MNAGKLVRLDLTKNPSTVLEKPRKKNTSFLELINHYRKMFHNAPEGDIFSPPPMLFILDLKGILEVSLAGDILTDILK